MLVGGRGNIDELLHISKSIMGASKDTTKEIREQKKKKQEIMMSAYYSNRPVAKSRKVHKTPQTQPKPRRIESVPKLLADKSLINTVELTKSSKIPKSYKLSIKKPRIVQTVYRLDPSSVSDFKKPKYLYCVGPNNNPDICMAAIKARSWWGPAPNQQSVNFFWLARFNVPYDLFDGGRHVRLINRFERYFEIHEKDNIFRNLWFCCRNSNRDVFQYMPLSFSFRTNERNFFGDLQSFARAFRSVQEKKSPKDVKPRCQTQDRFGQLHEIYYQFEGVVVPDRRPIPPEKNQFSNIETDCLKLPMPDCFDCGKNMWILKPSWLSRGRGIEIFSNLKELDNLLGKYLTGYEAKDYAYLNYSDKTEKSPVVKQSEPETLPESYKKFMDKYRPGKVSTFPVFVIQKYIEKPFLFKGFKFDIRMYGCLTHEYEVHTFQ